MKKIYGLLFLVLLLLLTACGKSTANKWQEQYDLGMLTAIVFVTAITVMENLHKSAKTYMTMKEIIRGIEYMTETGI